ncbi:hypothetical protein [Enterovibrio paralichthyis]|uniref:hypothetical protein n=1 Tax=Enterovibrio paralichthyis TaxID=2853805 RepID=UPI001C4467DE|nr:hypothetical protein [Enterovibrio paralichthyis]MBV7300211.1 hypothetical protein [Enterovibrio paralichthyis]
MNGFCFDVYGRAELSNDPWYGDDTCFMFAALVGGDCDTVSDAIKAATAAVERGAIKELVNVSAYVSFNPLLITVRDSAKRIVISGKVVGCSIRWFSPITEPNEISRAASHLLTVKIAANRALSHGDTTRAQTLTASGTAVQRLIADSPFHHSYFGAQELQSIKTETYHGFYYLI